MESQTFNQTQDTKKDRTMTITCTPTLIWYGTNPNNIGATIAFTETASDPDMPGAVGAQGNLNLSALPKKSKYNDNVDITFVLDPSQLKYADGTPITGNNILRWANANEGPTYVDGNGNTQHLGYAWFCHINSLVPLNYTTSPPIAVSDMSWVRSSDTQLILDDDTPLGSPVYAFMLAFVLPEFSNYYISVDPLIGTKNTRSDSFMLQS